MLKVLCTLHYFEKVPYLYCCQKLRAMKIKKLWVCRANSLCVKVFCFLFILDFFSKKNILTDVQEVRIIAFFQGNVKGCSIVQLWEFRHMNLLYCVSVMVVHFLSV